MDDELTRRREINDVMRHDVRTRVGIGNGYIAMLLTHHDALTPEQRAAALRGLADAFGRLDAFARRLLMDEKLQTRDLRADRTEISLDSLLAPLRTAYPDVVVEIDGTAPDPATLDPFQARDILDNLLANARAAAPPDTAVTLRVRGDGAGGVRFEVHDAGDGITEADRAVLFRRYGRTERSRRAKSAGTGLGLSTVRGLAEAHGGTYGVDTGDGTTFWVELPVTPPGDPSLDRT